MPSLEAYGPDNHDSQMGWRWGKLPFRTPHPLSRRKMFTHTHTFVKIFGAFGAENKSFSRFSQKTGSFFLRKNSFFGNLRCFSVGTSIFPVNTRVCLKYSNFFPWCLRHLEFLFTLPSGKKFRRPPPPPPCRLLPGEKPSWILWPKCIFALIRREIAHFGLILRR